MTEQSNGRRVFRDSADGGSRKAARQIPSKGAKLQSFTQAMELQLNIFNG
ncbi:MAG TPA: hypothetical protein PKN28_01740 [Clostridiales bacterium]|nr:hypothetical protein [Clostridiales bacterium]